MPREHVHAELMRMRAVDSTLRFQWYDNKAESWCDAPPDPAFYENLPYRVKPPCKKWRMYLVGDRTRPAVTDDPKVEDDKFFVAWIGDWQEQIV